jgi:HK97 family phage major capsid protein
MKSTRTFAVAALLAFAAVAAIAQIAAPEAAHAFVAAHPDILLGLSGLAFLGETTSLEAVREEIKGALQDLTRDHKAAMKDAKETAEKALDEVKKFNTVTAETNDALKKTGETTIKLQTDLVEMQQKMDKFTTQLAAAGGGGSDQKSIGEMVTESEQWKAAGKAGNAKMDAVEVGSFHKTAIINATGQNQPLVPAERAPMVMPANRPLVIRDLLPTFRTESNLIEFVKENVFTNNAAVQYASPQPESAAYENVTKPESGITFTMSNKAVVTIAHWIPASRQVLSDASMLQGYIGSRLLYGVKYTEEDEILNGDGSAGHISGLMTNATAYAGSGAVSADTQLDTLLRAMTQCFTGSLFAPDATVVNPVDWMKIRLLKDTTGRYIFGDPNSNQQPSVWGQRLVQSLSIAATRFLVGAFAPGAALWDREDATVRIAEQHGDFFIKNMVAILAEERVALTVFRPTAFIRGNFN